MNHRLLFPLDDDEESIVAPKPTTKSTTQRSDVTVHPTEPDAAKPQVRCTKKNRAARRTDVSSKRGLATQRLFVDLDPTDEAGTRSPAVPRAVEVTDVLSMDEGIAPLPLPPIENRLIRASAGTGKTYQLTSRFLRLLLLGVSPETILATTFTRKAAGEILDRVVTWLGRAALETAELRNLAQAVELPDLTHDDCLGKLAVLTRQMHRLQIQTIDAFFMQMAKSFSLELGMTPGWQVLEEGGPESNMLREQAIAGVLRQESLEDLLTLVYQIAPKGEAKRSLDQTLQGSVSQAYRLFVQSSAKSWDKLDVPPPLADDELEAVREAMAGYRDKKKRKGITQAIQQDVDRILKEDWAGFFGGGKSLARCINEGKEKYGNAILNDDLVELYQRFLPHLRSMTLYAARAQTVGTYHFLEKYHAEYQALKEAQRLYGFNEVTDLLATHTQSDDLSQLAFRMDHGIDHLLLDEFQDTSISQWRALATLAKRCSVAGSDRSFFCVGDVKQAIYGWRGGSSEIFDLLDKKLPNLVDSDLQESRRSSPVIIDVVNRVFGYLPDWDGKRLGRAARTAKRWQFPEHSTFHRDMPGYFAIETAEEVPNLLKETQEAGVFRRAAERVATISKQAKGRTIGILCRRNNKVGQMMNELQRLGIPASEEGGNYLTDSAAVQLVLSLLQLADHPADSMAAYHLATSPWAGSLGLEVGACSEFNWDPDDARAMDPDRPRPAAGIAPAAISKLVRHVRDRLLHHGFGETIQSWALQLRPFCNRREARRLTQLVERAYEYQNKIESPTQLGYQSQRRQSSRPSEFSRYIQETKVADPSNARIRVMTVHQAKGLEFDIVVLPDLLGPFIEGHETFLYRRPDVEADIDLVCRYMGKDSGRSFLPSKFLPLFDEFEDRSASESLCVLYVALTRAAHALHIFLPSGMQKMRGSKGHPGYLIKDAFIQGQALEPAKTMFELGDPNWFTQGTVAVTETDNDLEASSPEPRLARPRGTKRNLETLAPSQIGLNRYVRLSDRLSLARNAARDRGTVIHRWLAQLDWLDQQKCTSDDELIQVAEPFSEYVDIKQALAEFRAMLSTEEVLDILDHERYRADLQVQMPNLPANFDIEVRMEQPVAGRDGNRIITGTIDRLVLIRLASGELVAAEIIDYKTDTSDQTDDTSREQRRDRHETQIGAYRRVIRSTLRIENVTTRLVYLP